jgi:hypothetical protein
VPYQRFKKTLVNVWKSSSTAMISRIISSRSYSFDIEPF